MTLESMATFVCRKVRKTDTTSIARCKEFLARRYEMIWNEELWKDSLFALDFTYDITFDTTLPFGNAFCAGAGVWCLPSTVDMVVALRTDSEWLAVADQFQFYRTDFDAFSEVGQAVNFFPLGAAAADFSDQLATVESEGVVLLNSDTGDSGQVVRVRYIDLDGEEQVLSASLPAAVEYSNTFYPQAILSVTKNATLGAVSIVLDGSTVLSMAASATAAKRYPRIRVLPIPSEDTAMKALVKLKPQALDGDADTPALRGVENCLLALVQGDMLERARRYGQAQAKFAEGQALLDQLKRMAVVQESNRQQIVPEVTDPAGDAGWLGGKGYV